MVSRAEITAITVVAEEREHQKYLIRREEVKEATRNYCSTVLSEQLKEQANRPSHCLCVKMAMPDADGEAKVITQDTNNSSYSTPTGEYYNVATLVEFVKEHGFDVIIEDSTYRYSQRTNYGCKNIYIKW